MQFSYHKDSSKDLLIVEGELYKYLFKIRREKQGEFYFRNLQDKNIYKYKLISIDRKKAILELIEKKELLVEPKKYLHIGWSVIDPKVIEKSIAALNELGVSKITFFYAYYSQKKYKINFDRLEKLLINSSTQCGRSSIIELDFCDNLDLFLTKYQNSYMFNFSDNLIDNKKEDINTIIIGPEGGFYLDEIKQFNNDKIVGIDSNLILRSETATIAVASKVLI